MIISLKDIALVDAFEKDNPQLYHIIVLIVKSHIEEELVKVGFYE